MRSHARLGPLWRRVAGCSFDSGGSGCECEKWPQWIADNASRAQRAENFDGNLILDPEARGISAEKGTACSYYRPSGSKGFYFYNGLVQGVFEVQFPSGKRRIVVSLN